MLGDSTTVVSGTLELVEGVTTSTTVVGALVVTGTCVVLGALVVVVTRVVVVGAPVVVELVVVELVVVGAAVVVGGAAHVTVVETVFVTPLTVAVAVYTFVPTEEVFTVIVAIPLASVTAVNVCPASGPLLTVIDTVTPA